MKMRRDGRDTNTHSFVQHIDACLGCMACVTACPSGVQYNALLEAARPEVEREATRAFGERLFRRMIFATFPHPGRLRLLSWPLGIYQRLGLRRLAHRSGLLKLLPLRLQSMERLLPPMTFANAELPARIPAEGERRRRVGLLLGCVQRVFFGGVNRATARVLAAEGCEVIVPQNQACCGALAEHAGEEQDAMACARRLIDAFEAADVETVVVNAAGCGSAMKRYGHLLRNDPEYAGSRRRICGQMSRCRRSADRAGAARTARARRAPRRLSRRVSSSARAGHPRSAAAAASGDSRSGSQRDR